MNSFQFEDSELRANYMSQDEASELMELYAERQRQEAARQSLITIHDVAEATQLSSQEVERLLQEVRANRQGARTRNLSASRAASSPTVTSSIPTVVIAFQVLSPYLAIASAALGLFLHRQVETLAQATRYDQSYRNVENLEYIAFGYAFVTAIVFLIRYAYNRYKPGTLDRWVWRMIRNRTSP